MGNTTKYSQKYPPPFHLNVNGPPDNFNSYLYKDNKTYKTEPLDNTSKTPNSYALNEKKI